MRASAAPFLNQILKPIVYHWFMIDEFRRIVGRQKDIEQTQAFKDLNDEISDVENGRIKRFLGDGGQGRAAAKAQKDKREAETELQILLATNTAYAQLYRKTIDKLAAAEIAAGHALSRAEQALVAATETLAELRTGAARLEDGRMVFKDAQGRVRDEDGNILHHIDPDTVLWPEGAPSYEDWRAAKASAEAAQNRVDALQHYQVTVLGDIRDRLSDEDNPPSAEELETMQEEIDALMPPEVKAATREEAATTPDRSAAIDINPSVPDL